MNKRIIITKHAKMRMSDPGRGVLTEDEVMSVLRNPDVSYFGVDGKSNVLGIAGGRRIRVCFDEDDDRILVITVVNRGPAT